jgi:hypothetical protein
MPPNSLQTLRHDGRPTGPLGAGRAKLTRSTNRQKAALPSVKPGSGAAGQGRPAGAVRPPGGSFGANGVVSHRHRDVSAQLRAAGARAGR